MPALHSLHPCSCNHMKHVSHLCSFREYVFAFFSCISWDFSEFAALLSIYSTRSQPLSRLRKTKQKEKTRTGDFSSSSSSSLEDAAGVAGENRQVRFPDLHSTRGKVSRDLISVSSETSEQTDKFLHCGAEEAGGEKPHARGGEGFN